MLNIINSVDKAIYFIKWRLYILDANVVLFSAYAQLPSGTVSSEIYGVMALVVLIEMESGTIVDAECTLSTPLSQKFVAELLRGKSLRQSPKALTDLIGEVYQGNAKKAIITALRIIFDKYTAYASGSNTKKSQY